MTTVEKQSFGTLLRHYRQAHALTQEELAEHAELSVRQLAYLERDRHAARPSTIRRLADALALPEEDRQALLAAAGMGGTQDESAPVTAGLPVPPTPFIGRRRDIAVVVKRLLQPEVRLLTLTGPGGIGKTRLAIEVASQVATQFSDGVVFVGLADVRSADRVPEAIAGALGLIEQGEWRHMKLLAEHFRERHSLLILDNLEHLLDAGAQVGQLLAACAQLKVLVTSRAVLRLSAEHVVDVPPLSCPDPIHLPSLEDVRRSDAVALLSSKARANAQDFAVTEENAAVVAGICHRLDGVPLAIELAAARVPLFSPEALLQRLTHSLPLLTAGARDAPDRQQTLRRTIDWSYDLLTPVEQSLFAQLSVFAGGCTVEAAEAICVLDPDAGSDVVEGLASLREKSLLQTTGGRPGEPRFSMLETIREYAQEALERGPDADEPRLRHAEYFTRLAEQMVAELSLVRTGGSPSIRIFRVAEEEAENFHAALSWLVERRETELGLRLAGAIAEPWLTLGRERGLYAALEALLGQRADVPPLVLAQALLAAGWCGPCGDSGQGRDDMFDRALAIFREVGDQRALLGALLQVGGAHVYHWGDVSHAEELYEEALALARDLGVSSALAASLRGLGEIAQQKDAPERARLLFEESLAVELAASNTGGIAHSLHALAWRALMDHHPSRAAELAEQAEGTYREVRQLRQVADVRLLQGIAALMAGDHAGLHATFRASIAEESFRRFDYVGWNWLVLMGASWAARGEPLRGARLFAAATEHEPIYNTELRPFTGLLEGCLAVGRASVDERAWEAAREEGRPMTQLDAIAEALG